MKIIWITNITFPEALSLMGVDYNHKGSGGWLLGASNALVAIKNISLTVVSVNNAVTKLTQLEGVKIKYYILPQCNHTQQYEHYMQEIQEKERPDIVHIHGTEFPYGRAWLNVCPLDNVVVSIQGLVHEIAKYYLSGLSTAEIVRNITLRDFFRKTIFKEQADFYRKAEDEKEVFKRVHHVIGRTNFDYVHSKAINPFVKYHHCNETLRPEFYLDKWSYSNCEPHTIFMSQASYPIKGLHMVLKALPYIIEKYPDAKLRIAGNNISKCESIRDYFFQTGYGKIVRKLILKSNLGDRVKFTGRLDVIGMKKEYLRANLFLCPSSIENSPNSLGEAQLLGVPVIASYAGGIPDMMRGDENHLYRFDDVEMLAWKICQVFESRDTVDTSYMCEVSKKRHDPIQNVQCLIDIYNTIVH